MAYVHVQNQGIRLCWQCHVLCYNLCPVRWLEKKRAEERTRAKEFKEFHKVQIEEARKIKWSLDQRCITLNPSAKHTTYVFKHCATTHMYVCIHSGVHSSQTR